MQTITSVRRPVGSRLRADAPLGQLRLAVARALIVTMRTPGDWRDLALSVDAENEVVHHLRLPEGLPRNDGDYTDRVHRAVPAVPGLRIEEIDCDGSEADGLEHGHEDIHLDQLAVLEEHLNLPEWLAEHEPRLHRVLYGADPAEAAAPDAVTTTIGGLELPEIVRQLDRLRRDLADDRPAAVGHAEDLVESACKTVLAEEGPGAGTRKFPSLVAAALRGWFVRFWMGSRCR